jgi:hypothetical protein
MFYVKRKTRVYYFAENHAAVGFMQTDYSAAEGLTFVLIRAAKK